MKLLRKILLVILGLAAVGIIAMLLVGYFNPNVSYETHVTINKPRAEVWRLFVDELQTGKWLTGFKSIETISGPPHTPGSKFRIKISQNGRDFEMTEVMKEYREPEVFAMTLEGDLFTDDVRMVFTDQGDKTELVQSEVVTGKNIFCKALIVFTRSYFMGGARNNLDNLKRFVESTPAGGAP